MKERLIIIFVALIAGLFITSAGFVIYQSTKAEEDSPVNNPQTTITPTEEQNTNGLFIKVVEPTDELITEKRSITVKGNTNPDNIIVVSTNLQDVQGSPTQNGDFSVTIGIDAGANTIITRAIAPDGTSVEDIKTVTFSTEEF